jgi:hypothetical protein
MIAVTMILCLIEKGKSASKLGIAVTKLKHFGTNAVLATRIFKRI